MVKVMLGPLVVPEDDIETVGILRGIAHGLGALLVRLGPRHRGIDAGRSAEVYQSRQIP